MSLTRKFLSALGIEDDKVDEIISAHTDTVNALKEQRDTYKADAEKLPAVQKELDDLKAAAEKNGEDAYKVKYDALKEDFDAFKAQQDEKEKHAKKADAYKALLQEVGISEKRIGSVLKVSDIDSIEFDDEGKVKEADTLKKAIGEEWADFIVKTERTRSWRSRTRKRDRMPLPKIMKCLDFKEITNGNKRNKRRRNQSYQSGTDEESQRG